MAKQQFRKGFLQKSKKGNYIINVVRIGGQKIAIKHTPEVKIEKPTKPLVDVKKPEIKIEKPTKPLVDVKKPEIKE